MNHKHFDIISSTQTYLIENPAYDLVTAKKQSLGRGRGSNIWDSYDNSLAFSFTLSPSNTKTLTSLEVGVLICDYIHSAKLKLKWPNDILTQDGKKCGGILLQLQDDRLVVGVGLNWGTSTDASSTYKTEKGSILATSLNQDQYQTIPKDIYNYILSHRLSDEEIIFKWNNLCYHSNKEVSIIDTEQERGIFKKIGPYGEAYLDIDGKLKKFFAGSLIIH